MLGGHGICPWSKPKRSSLLSLLWFVLVGRSVGCASEGIRESGSRDPKQKPKKIVGCVCVWCRSRRVGYAHPRASENQALDPSKQKTKSCCRKCFVFFLVSCAGCATSMGHRGIVPEREKPSRAAKKQTNKQTNKQTESCYVLCVGRSSDATDRRHPDIRKSLSTPKSCCCCCCWVCIVSLCRVVFCVSVVAQTQTHTHKRDQEYIGPGMGPLGEKVIVLYYIIQQTKSNVSSVHHIYTSPTPDACRVSQTSNHRESSLVLRSRSMLTSTTVKNGRDA
jgi:hypothetical protein